MHIFVNKINQCLCHVSEYQSVSEKNSHHFLLCVVAFEHFWVLFYFFYEKVKIYFKETKASMYMLSNFVATNHKDF